MSSLLFYRQANGDGAAGSRVVGGGYRAAHRNDVFFNYGQTDAGSTGGLVQAGIGTVKIVKYFFQGMARNARACVGYADLYRVAVLMDVASSMTPSISALTRRM